MKYELSALALSSIRDDVELQALICKICGIQSATLIRATYIKKKPLWLTLYGVVEAIEKRTGLQKNQILKKL